MDGAGGKVAAVVNVKGGDLRISKDETDAVKPIGSFRYRIVCGPRARIIACGVFAVALMGHLCGLAVPFLKSPADPVIKCS
jgi:hypothetical protein